jgi:hypothetical protein
VAHDCAQSNKTQPTPDGPPNSVAPRTQSSSRLDRRPADPSVFRDEILPGLRNRSINQLVAATGLSEHYCSPIRLGKRVPHPRHWDVWSSPAFVNT